MKRYNKKKMTYYPQNTLYLERVFAGDLLDEKYKAVLAYYIDAGNQKTATMIAQAIGCSRQYVSQCLYCLYVAGLVTQEQIIAKRSHAKKKRFTSDAVQGWERTALRLYRKVYADYVSWYKSAMVKHKKEEK